MTALNILCLVGAILCAIIFLSIFRKLGGQGFPFMFAAFVYAIIIRCINLITDSKVLGFTTNELIIGIWILLVIGSYKLLLAVYQIKGNNKSFFMTIKWMFGRK
jgi:hypothetical protein